VFVYGTLLHGLRNHYLLEAADVTFLGAARTVGAFEMWDAGGFPFVSRRGATTPVVGEVYRVDGETLRKLDVLEGHPGWYERVEVPVRLVGVGGRELRAAMYVSDVMRGEAMVGDGDYRVWLARKAAGRRAVGVWQGANAGRRP
jgi:gamma-glutamylaminecyclotransferase